MRSFVRGCGLLALAVLLLLSLASLFAPSRTPAFGGSPLSSHQITVVAFLSSSSSVIGDPSLSEAFIDRVLTSYGSPAVGLGRALVIGRYVQLDRRGMGCCPFGWHHDDGKDARPSLWVHAPRSSGAPCWYSYAWRRGGNLFDFLCLWYNLSAQEMWRRILAGDSF